MNRSQSRKSAFSLLEILVVLAIAAVIGSLTLGGFSSFQGSQRRTTCQSNLVQIYRACRLYANDNDSYPLLTRRVNGGTTDVKVGGLAMLWGHCDGSPSTGPVIRPPSDGALSYLKSSNPLHCPADVGDSTTPTQVAIKDDGTGTGATILDPNFLSYQKPDRDDTTQWSYDDVRLKLPVSGGTIDADFPRQLQHRTTADTVINIPTPSSTVVTWCTFHRGVASGSKPDNVLFYDGAVRRMETTQPAGCLPGRSASTGWKRLSECSTSNAASNEGAALAQP